MTAPLLRVGLVGAGWVTQHHLPAWLAIGDRARVVAIADPNLAHARQRADAFGIERVFASLPEMLAAGGIDALDIAAPREFHADAVRSAAAHGLPVLCQKPLAPTLAQAEALASEVRVLIRLMVHENWRFRPVYRLVESWLQQGRIGRVLQARMTVVSSGLLPDAQGRYPAIDRQPFMATLDRALVMEVLIHHIDTLRFLLGDLRLVHAQLGRSCPAMRGEDRADLLFEATGGAPVHLLGNWCVHGEPPSAPDALLLIGERGTIELDGNTLRCHGESPAEQELDLAAGYAASYAATIAHFVDALASGAPFETAPDDNLRTLALVENIYR